VHALSVQVPAQTWQAAPDFPQALAACPAAHSPAALQQPAQVVESQAFAQTEFTHP
jgi:hypothetical protein